MDSLLCLLHAFYKISDKSPKQKESLALKNILNSKCKTITYQQKFYADHSNVSARQVVLIWKLMHSLSKCVRMFTSWNFEFPPQIALQSFTMLIASHEFFSSCTIYTFSNKQFTVTRYLYIWIYLGFQSKNPLQNSL